MHTLNEFSGCSEHLGAASTEIFVRPKYRRKARFLYVNCEINKPLSPLERYQTMRFIVDEV